MIEEERVLMYMKEHPNKWICLSEIAKETNVSTNTVAKVLSYHDNVSKKYMTSYLWQEVSE